MDQEPTLSKIAEILIFLMLIGCMVLRFFTNNPNAIAALSYLSLLMAWIDLYIGFRNRLQYYKEPYYFMNGLFLILTILYMGAGIVFVFMGIAVNSLLADELSLAALLLSIPQALYYRMLEHWLKKRSQQLQFGPDGKDH